MLVTINTDASYREGCAGYAFWIVCDAGKIQKAGRIQGKTLGSVQSEMMCIANAIYTLKHSKFKGVNKVIVNTDSLTSINYLVGESKFKSESPLGCAIDEARFNMMEVCMKFGKSIRDISTMFEFRHVKAHSGKKDSRSYVNEWCDKEAKKYCKQSYLNTKTI